MFEIFFKKKVLNRISGFRNIDGWLTDQEALGLYTVAHKLGKNATVVEIGSWQGKSTYCIAKGLRYGKVYAIDPFNADAGLDAGSENEYREKKGNSDLLENFTENMKCRGVLDKIKIMKGYSYDYIHAFTNIDFLFIDGDHSIPGTTLDFELFAPKILPGGFLAFHDFYEQRNELGPTYVIKNIVSKSGDFSFYRQYDTLWIAKKLR